jgi:hypothetical protein
MVNGTKGAYPDQESGVVAGIGRGKQKTGVRIQNCSAPMCTSLIDPLIELSVALGSHLKNKNKE